MTRIDLVTEIDADVTTCFDLARSVDAHKSSTAKTNEKAVAGRTTGLCERGDKITWEATHFGIKQNLSVEIVQLDIPYFFEDRMIKGAFKSMRHEHHFKFIEGKTVMTDKFEYEVPYGVIGTVFDKIILRTFMTKFLEERNQVLKNLAENNIEV